MEINTDFLTGAFVGLLMIIAIWGVFVGIMADKSRREFKRFSEETDRKHEEFKKNANERFEAFKQDKRK